MSDSHIHRLLKQMGLSTKPKPVQETTPQNVNSKNIVIRELKSDLNLDPALGILTTFNTSHN